ncbi:MAG: hypothetical protein EXR98_08900 [Gemmataceae bacterium]|nr:hypothetical protein [Gemmataceae bacterium]
MRFVTASLGLIWFTAPISAQGDPVELKSLRLDADPGYRTLRTDTLGRLFVGGREALFVYEPNGRDAYHARRLLAKFPPGTTINDIEIRGHDLYVLTATALYVVPDGARKRDKLTPRKLLWGVPGPNVLRSLAWGPEGDLYIAFGNPAAPGRWAYWTYFSETDKSKTPYRGAGGILRCTPDGTQVRIVARGLQNPGGLLFDRHWNCFVRDGSRLLRVEHAYFGDPVPPVLDGVQPILGYLDDKPFPAKYRHQFLNRRADGLTRLTLEGTEHLLVACKKPIAVTVGRGGRIFAILESGELVMHSAKGDPFAPYDAAEATPAKLWQELNDPSWQRRYRAHIEMTRRGGAFLTDANDRLLNAKADDPAQHHLIWLAAKSGKGSLHLLALVSDADPRVRVQTLRALAEFSEQLREEPIFTKTLLDENLRVQHAAILAYFSSKVAWDRAIQRTIERAAAKEPYLRKSAALLLAQKATLKQLEELCASDDADRRLVGVVAAAYRLTLANTTSPLAQHLPLAKFKDEFAFMIEYADGKLDLRDLGRVGSFTRAEHWKADKRPAEEELTFKLLRRMANDEDGAVRTEAVQFLKLLAN